MLTGLCIVAFMFSLFTPFSVVCMTAGVAVGLIKGYWLILISSVAGFLLQLMIRGSSTSGK